MVHLICCNCSRPNSHEAKFCGACGAGLLRKFCKSCRTLNDADSGFCRSCGTALESRVHPFMAPPDEASQAANVQILDPTPRRFAAGQEKDVSCAPLARTSAQVNEVARQATPLGSSSPATGRGGQQHKSRRLLIAAGIVAAAAAVALGGLWPKIADAWAASDMGSIVWLGVDGAAPVAGIDDADTAAGPAPTTAEGAVASPAPASASGAAAMRLSTVKAVAYETQPARSLAMTEYSRQPDRVARGSAAVSNPMADTIQGSTAECTPTQNLLDSCTATNRKGR